MIRDYKEHCGTILRQICESEDIIILKGVISIDHVHMHINYLLSLLICNLIKNVKGRNSRILQQEYPELRERFWVNTFELIGYEWYAIKGAEKLLRNKNIKLIYLELFLLP